ncbi:hypothetical protein BDK51DRAFT_41903 [Blyttiomyces helicus]|uniref:F-box/LRR-repeat protein 15-like leucin rich repeat domain-containing protein n=1 Tax=Blyttiomyces helicus TaxID=388810 RepID=A0A4P9W868_9FUNG|nr:hypothetical protein BDK51DRAFT_41903 [Blyttiomyces helicus]|eukprot:RKO88711.1 hypothetical protein BDK51DRAFT_41903 [Blyttiomyces helicus]
MDSPSTVLRPRVVPPPPPEILDRIFQTVSLTTHSEALRTLYTCCLVSHAYYWSACSALWARPTFPTLHSFVRFVAACHARRARERLQGRRPRAGTDDEGSTPSWIGKWGLESIRDFAPTRTAHLPAFVVQHHLSLVADARPALTALSLAGCVHVEDTAVVQMVAACAESLMTLDLENCWRVSNLCVRVVAELCGPHGRIKRLGLRGLGRVSDIGLEAIGTHLAGSLVALDLTWCRRVGDGAMMRFLRRVAARGVDVDEDGGLNVVNAPASGRLVELRFARCRKFTRIGFKAVVEFAVKTNPKLEILEFSIPDPPHRLPSPTQQSPVIAFDAFPTALLANITSLHISRARSLQGRSLFLLADVCGPRLKQLSLTDSAASEHALLYLLTHTPHLTSLSLQNARAGVTPTFLRHLGLSPSIRTLTDLNLGGCRGVEATGLRALWDSTVPDPLAAQTAPDSAVDVSPPAILAPGSRCLALVSLDVSDSQVSLPDLTALAAACAPPLGNLARIAYGGTPAAAEVDRLRAISLHAALFLDEAVCVPGRFPEPMEADSTLALAESELMAEAPVAVGGTAPLRTVENINFPSLHPAAPMGFTIPRALVMSLCSRYCILLHIMMAAALEPIHSHA